MKTVWSRQNKKRILLIIMTGVLLASLGFLLYRTFMPQPVPPANSEAAPEVSPASGNVELERWPEITREKLLAEVNKRRAAVGAPALRMDERLNSSAQAKCDDMAANGYFAHVSPVSGKQGYELASAAMDMQRGFYGENILRSLPQNTAEQLFDQWFTSEPHKKGALDPRQELTGFGVCGLRYVVEHFYSTDTSNR